MRNAKEEFLKITEKYKIVAVTISFDEYSENPEKEFKLKPGYTKSEYENLLKFLDRDYDSGYGGQQLFGMIYCQDNVWFDRGEYDGSEWWSGHKYPDLRDNFDESTILKYERSQKLKKLEK